MREGEQSRGCFAGARFRIKAYIRVRLDVGRGEEKRGEGGWGWGFNSPLFGCSFKEEEEGFERVCLIPPDPLFLFPLYG